MKVLHLLSTSKFSGAENVACQIIKMISNDDRFDMVYCSPDGDIKNTLIEKGIKFRPLHSLSVSNVKKAIQEQNPDIIHAHDMKASFIAALACGKIPLVSHIHNNAYNSRGISLKSIAYTFAGFKAKHIFWVSDTSFSGYFFHNMFKSKSSILYNIIDVDALIENMKKDNTEYDYDIIYVGRLTYPKNPQRLLKVLKQAIGKKPDLKIAIIGSGELENETIKLAKELGIDSNIFFGGFQKNPLKMMHDSKVMIMTSRWEGTPMCALEGMALGLPLVSTPVDGLKKLVKNGETGYLSDCDDELSKRIVSIVENNDLHQKLSENSRQASQVINDKKVYIDELRKVYLK